MADDVRMDNAKHEVMLTDLYMKKCTKICPNPRCQVRICKVKSGCTHVQCTICFHYMCWACGKPAKGQKHFKENPDCIDEEKSLLPEHITAEMIQKFLGYQDDPTINLKHCALCPRCGELNQKHGTLNLLNCKKCAEGFCYICNKAVAGMKHYQGTSQCHENSDHYMDF